MIQVKIGFKRALLIALIGLVTSLNTGCARTLTAKVVELDVAIEITFAGPVDTNSFNYLLIFSLTQFPVTPGAGSTDFNQYFPVPGTVIDESNPVIINNGLNYFYANYFNTWSDYINVHNNQTNLYKSNAANFDPSTTNNLDFPRETNFTSTLTISGNKLTVVFPIASLSNATLGFPQLFFTFAVTNLADGVQNGNIIDTLTLQTSVLQQPNQTIGEGLNDDQDSSIPTSADILTWKVTIF